MRLYRRLPAAALALAATGFGPPQPELFACHGSFAILARGFVTGRPSELNFVVDWQAPSIATDTGRPGRITALTVLEVAFEVQYDTYKAAYRINRIDGTISQTSNFGGLFRGVCELKPLRTKF